MQSNDIAGQIALQSAIKFNGGGRINHSLFWQNLSPAASSDSKTESAPGLVAEIEKTWGSLEKFRQVFSAALLAYRGSGWGWLVKEQTGLRIVTTKDPGPPGGWGSPHLRR